MNPKLPPPLAGWGAVAVIAAYLTFFPVAINTFQGVRTVDGRLHELTGPPNSPCPLPRSPGQRVLACLPPGPAGTGGIARWKRRGLATLLR